MPSPGLPNTCCLNLVLHSIDYDVRFLSAVRTEAKDRMLHNISGNTSNLLIGSCPFEITDDIKVTKSPPFAGI